MKDKLECNKCKEWLNVSKFYRVYASNRKRKYGYTCKECSRSINHVHTTTWKSKNKKYTKQYLAFDRLKNRNKHSARNAVNNGLKNGTIKKQPCKLCGKAKVEAHHESYLKKDWLNVVWLCVKHHTNRHVELREMGVTL